ncbi:MAG TPA: hypothetical protein VG871_00415 [Vicinamibacterales bacterium]|nr:hypothetical protein [Vicinamibacterales bacterium]
MKTTYVALCSAVVALACARGPASSNAAAAEAGAAPATTAAAVQPVASTGTLPAGGDVENASDRGTDYREVTIPAGTVLRVELQTPVASDTSRVEQPVHGTLRRAITVRGQQIVPAGAAISGHVTSVRRPGRVQGRSYVGMRFTELDTPGAGASRISTATVGRLGRTTKGKDAIEVLGPAAAGAVIGRLAGGKSGARKGAVIGGAGGGAYVLGTRGEDVRLGRGTPLAVRLTAPLTVRVEVKR